MSRAVVAWFTGLSGAGKSTIANEVTLRLRKRGRRVLVLDGDEVRRRLHSHLGFSAADIRANNSLIAELCQQSLQDADVILVPVISPFRDVRAKARAQLGNSFHEIFIRASLEAVELRDPKGLYRKARGGELPGMIGIAPDVAYEAPEFPDLVLDTEAGTASEMADQLVKYIEAHLSRR